MKKAIVTILWLLLVTHFLKDITQDILHIPTFLDKLGNIEEDLSFLPEWGRGVYLFGLGGLSIIAEIFLIINLPYFLFNKVGTVRKAIISYCVIYLLVFFVTAVLLDPIYKTISSLYFGAKDIELRLLADPLTE